MHVDDLINELEDYCSKSDDAMNESDDHTNDDDENGVDRGGDCRDGRFWMKSTKSNSGIPIGRGGEWGQDWYTQ